jgi:hypothetical protein
VSSGYIPECGDITNEPENRVWGEKGTLGPDREVTAAGENLEKRLFILCKPSQILFE